MSATVRDYCLMSALLVAFASCVSCVPSVIVSSPTAKQLQAQRSTAVRVISTITPDRTGHEFDVTESEAFGSVGSGAVFAFKNDKSLVVTAGHVCEHEIIEKQRADGTKFQMKVVLEMIHVETADGSVLVALPVVIDKKIDICILIVAGNAGAVAEFTSETPPIGSQISYVGAPGNVWNAPAVPIVEGRFSGFDGDDNVLSMAIIGGASGSGVFYNGKLFSVVTKRAMTFYGVGYGISTENTFKYLDTARRAFYAN